MVGVSVNGGLSTGVGTPMQYAMALKKVNCEQFIVNCECGNDRRSIILAAVCVCRPKMESGRQPCEITAIEHAPNERTRALRAHK